MRGKRAIEVVQLRATGSRNGDCDAQILSALALAQFNRTGVKFGVELLGYVNNSLSQAIDPGAHHFDWKLTRVGD